MGELDPIPPEMQLLVEEFADVFATPTELPPRRHCDHKIPLIPGARPISMRPYRIVPQLKDELEKKIKERKNGNNGRRRRTKSMTLGVESLESGGIPRVRL